MRTASNQEDYWVWVHNMNGSYSVKSGYWFINCFRIGQEIQEAEARPSLNVLKEEVWKIPTTPKIRNFIWRAISNAIPVGESLVIRGIKMDPVCQACGFQGESINHIIFRSSIARQVWALANVPHPEEGFDEVSHDANFHLLLLLMKNSNIPEEVKNSIPWIVWYFWKYKNEIIFEGKQGSDIDLVAKVREEADFLLVAQKNEKRRCREEHEAVTVVKKSWSAPQIGWLKCNIGVSWIKATKSCGAAWVVPNNTCRVVLHSRRAFSNITSKEEANLVFWCGQ